MKNALLEEDELAYEADTFIKLEKLHPIILTGVKPKMKIYNEERFGPVLALCVVNSDAEAIELVSSSKFRLTAGVYCKGHWLCVRHRSAAQRDGGQVYINFLLGQAPTKVGFATRRSTV